MLCYLFLFIFTCEALPHRGYSTQSSDLHIQEFAVGICRENSPWEFAARICRGYLPREFAVGICCKNLPCLFAAGIFRGYLLREFAAEICRGYLPWLFVRKSFFVYVTKSCSYESKPFLYVSNTFYL